MIPAKVLRFGILLTLKKSGINIQVEDGHGRILFRSLCPGKKNKGVCRFFGIMWVNVFLYSKAKVIHTEVPRKSVASEYLAEDEFGNSTLYIV